jgi:hypothetical protein
MRRTFTLASAMILLPWLAVAQEKQSSTVDEKREDRAAAGDDLAASRMKALEEQVQALAAEVAMLRGEVKELREARAPGTAPESRLMLASAKIEPRMIPDPAPGAPAALPSPAAVPAPAQTTQAASYGGATSNAKLLNPDISMIGDFIGTAGHNPASLSPSLEMHESELGVQAIIDPYARGDFFLSFGETGVNVEEGYITFTSLPGGVILKVGKMRADFGKVNTIHNHALSYIDRPLVTDNLVGGEDGIDDAGISLSRILPAPKNWFLEGTAQVFRGDSADVFHASEAKDVSVVGHLRGYRDLNESTNLDLGVSYARGHNSAGSNFLTDLYGVDATLRWKPLRRAIYHSLLWRNELIWSNRNQLSSLFAPETQHAFGLYSSLDYRMNRRWTVGGRFDRSGRATNASLTDTGFSAILTYWPSEFSQIRTQYRFGRYAGGIDANELLLQFIFVLGAHGAHPF